MIQSRQSVYINSIPEACRNILPKTWNIKDKFPSLCVGTDDLTITYTGFGLSSHDAAAIRADNEIPKECGIFYFEVAIDDDGKDGYLAVGLMERQSNLQRLPGWDKNSYGYHADDGKAFNASVNGEDYGPPYSRGDVIGCGLNRLRSTIFYTKNGLNLGAACNKSVGNIHPAVGMQSTDCQVKANFGQEPYMFDIDDYVMKEQATLSKIITICPWPLTRNVYGRSGCVDPKTCQLNSQQERKNNYRQIFAMIYFMTDEIKRLVQGYFKHHGYANSAVKFVEEIKLAVDLLSEDTADNCDLITRRNIQQLILSGKPGAAAGIVREKYPSVFASNPKLFYEVCVQNFIESVRCNEAPFFSDKSFYDLISSDTPVDLTVSQMDVDESTSTASGDDTIAEEAPNVKLVPELNGWDRASGELAEYSDIVKSFLLASTIFKASLVLFDSQGQKAEHNRLKDIFSMMAYENFDNVEEFKSIISVDQRMNLAIELNSAILTGFNKFPKPAVDQFINHLSIIANFVNEKVEGFGGLIDSDRWI